MFGEGEIHGDLLCQNPYRVFFQIVESVAMASSSLISSPRPDRPTNTVVKFSNSSAIAAAVCSGSSSVAVALLLCAPHGCGDDVHAEAPELVLHAGESLLCRGQLGDCDHDSDVLLEHVPVAGDHGREELAVVRPSPAGAGSAPTE